MTIKVKGYNFMKTQHWSSRHQCATHSIMVIVGTCASVLLTACSGGSVLERMQQIELAADEYPTKALEMLDSLGRDIEDESKYVRKKYDLLNLILYDKAGTAPQLQHDALWRLIAYFEEKGSPLEKQQVYYYAGRASRKMQNTAGAFDCLVRSAYYAIAGGECDSALLRATFRNIYELHISIQDYSNALTAARLELEAYRPTTEAAPCEAYLHIGIACLGMDSTQLAEAAFDSAYEQIARTDIASPEHLHQLARLLRGYSMLNNIEKAAKCKALIEGNHPEDLNAGGLIALACYYKALGNYDSANICGRRAFDKKTDFSKMYEAVRLLYRMCRDRGDEAGAAFYLEGYMQLRDSLDARLNQELAETAVKHFQHIQSQKEEVKKKKGREMLVGISIVLVVLGFILHIIYKERWHRRIVGGLSSDIAEKDQQLAEKDERNQMLTSIIHRSELETRAEDIMQVLKQCAAGKREMTAADWKQVYHAVDELDQTFKQRLPSGEMGTVTEQQMQIMYLMRIGLTNMQIQNVTNLSRQTIWRWRKKYLAFNS
ncbi:MAG: hypothetical protein IJ148_02595 [Bacteroidaceae bacterium]|nr:hypothetical protein [Bacteroidaceae bacterium]